MPEVECWTGDPACSYSPRRWHRYVETCRRDTYNELRFMIVFYCILLRALVGQYTEYTEMHSMSNKITYAAIHHLVLRRRVILGDICGT